MGSEPKKKIKTSVVMDPDLWAEFKVHSARKRVDPSNEMARLVEKELHGPRIYTGEDLHKLLDEVIEQGGGRHVDTISGLLELVTFAIRIGGRYTLEELRDLRKHLLNLPPED